VVLAVSSARMLERMPLNGIAGADLHVHTIAGHVGLRAGVGHSQRRGIGVREVPHEDHTATGPVAPTPTGQSFLLYFFSFWPPVRGSRRI
jgi:hypothetical protein